MTTPRPEVLAKLTPVLTRRWLEPDAWRIETYERLDGYRALRKALARALAGEFADLFDSKR